jgi:hypothetical protein
LVKTGDPNVVSADNEAGLIIYRITSLSRICCLYKDVTIADEGLQWRNQ